MKMCNVMCVQPKIHYLQAWHNSIKIDKTVILGVIDNNNLRSIYRYIFQTSGDFAGEWKIATIIPLLKKNGLAFLIVIWKD